GDPPRDLRALAPYRPRPRRHRPAAIRVAAAPGAGQRRPLSRPARGAALRPAAVRPAVARGADRRFTRLQPEEGGNMKLLSGAAAALLAALLASCSPAGGTDN